MSAGNKHVKEIAQHIVDWTHRDDADKFVATAQKVFAGKITPEIDKADFQQVLSNLFGAATIYGIHHHNAGFAAYCRDPERAAVIGAKAENDLSGFDVCLDALAGLYQPAPGDKMAIMKELDITVRKMNRGLNMSATFSPDEIGPAPRGKSKKELKVA